MLGDTTSHGGTVIGADLTCSINGKYLARVGDMVVCPKCRGIFPIKTGAPDMISMKQAPARHGDTTECGAVLISGQITTYWGNESSTGDPAADDKEDALALASQGVAPATSGLCLECLLSAAAAGSATVVRE